MIEKLKATIAELESELAEIETLDPETKRLLETAAADISAALADKSNAEALPPVSESVAKDGVPQEGDSPLLDAAASFEASHPQLAGIVRRLVDAMGQIGI